jgi:hypothetical protein
LVTHNSQSQGTVTGNISYTNYNYNSDPPPRRPRISPVNVEKSKQELLADRQEEAQNDDINDKNDSDDEDSVLQNRRGSNFKGLSQMTIDKSQPLGSGSSSSSPPLESGSSSSSSSSSNLFHASTKVPPKQTITPNVRASGRHKP